MKYVMFLYFITYMCNMRSSGYRSRTPHPKHNSTRLNGISTQYQSAGTAYRVVGGKAADIEEFPSIACLVLKQNMKDKFKGGATIIAPYWAVTAAHCMIHIPETDILEKKVFVHSNSKYWKKEHTMRLIVKAYSHEKYNDDITDFDIALVKVRRPFSGRNEKPIRIADPNYKYIDDSIATAVGWGMTDPNARVAFVSTSLESVDIRIINHTVCRNIYEAQLNNITDQMLCAAAPGKDACVNDSGGPLYQNGTLVGIVSWGPQKCSDPVYPGVYSRISVLHNWISKKIKPATLW